MKIEQNGGAERFEKRLVELQDRLTTLQPPMAAAGTYLANRAKDRFRNEGGDQHWVPSKGANRTGIRTGRLWNSITSRTEGAGATLTAVVGTDVNYAKWFQEGTGIYAGHRQWTVTPVNGKALRFKIGRRVVFARKVVIPGQPARPFILIAPGDNERIVAIFKRYLATGVVDDVATT